MINNLFVLAQLIMYSGFLNQKISIISVRQFNFNLEHERNHFLSFLNLILIILHHHYALLIMIYF